MAWLQKNQSALSLPAPHVDYEQGERLGKGGTLGMEGVRWEERLRAQKCNNQLASGCRVRQSSPWSPMAYGIE